MPDSRKYCVFSHKYCEDGIDCESQLSGLLTGPEIEKHEIILIDNDNTELLKGTSYDLRLGGGHYVFDDKSNSWEAYFIGTESEFSKANENTSDKFKRQDRFHVKTLTIPPFGTALIQLYETVDTYSVAKNKEILVAGHFDLKLSMVQKGIVSQQATQVEPCYKGKLFCFLFNHTANNIELKYKDKIATIEFSYVSCASYCNDNSRTKIISDFSDEVERKFGDNNPYCADGRGISDVRFWSTESDSDRMLPKSGGLSFFYSEFEKKEKELDKDTIINNVIERANKEYGWKFKWLDLKWKIILAIVGMVVPIVLGWLSTFLTNQSNLNKNKNDMDSYFNEKQKQFDSYAKQKEQAYTSSTNETLNKAVTKAIQSIRNSSNSVSR